MHNDAFKWDFSNDIPGNLPALALEDEGTATSIDDAKASPKNLEIYPNPAVNEITINTIHLARNTRFVISDLNGKTILSGIIKNKTIAISTIKKGIYLLRVTNEEITSYCKFIKE